MPTPNTRIEPHDPILPWGGDLSATPAAPSQAAVSYLTEFKNSREITKDLQRESIVERWVLRGTPDEADLDVALQAYKTGKPHPWFPKPPNTSPSNNAGLSNAYLTNIRFRHLSFGTEAVTSGQQGEAQSWTIAIVTFTQRPCPALYEEQWTVALQPYQEWYSLPLTDAEKQAGDEYPGRNERGDVIPAFLSKSLLPVPILRPVPVYQRRYLKVRLTRREIRVLREATGKLNGFKFLDDPPGMWMFDGFQANLLHGNDDPKTPDVGWYELTLVFRADPLRKHRFTAPKIPETGLNAVDPTKAPQLFPDYESLHSFTKQYSYSMLDWNGSPGKNFFTTCNREDTDLQLP